MGFGNSEQQTYLLAATSYGSSVVMAHDLVGRAFFLGPRTLLLVMEVRAAVSSITPDVSYMSDRKIIMIHADTSQTKTD